jgi:protein-tyrosine-phosphatase
VGYGYTDGARVVKYPAGVCTKSAKRAEGRLSYFPGKWYEDWGVIDPAGRPSEAVRATLDEIKVRIAALVGDLLTARP